ncbi:MAG: BREX system Lon protease-like protein BrxL [Thermofilum sp.]
MLSSAGSKVRRIFGDAVVDKGLARRVGVSRVPAFITEYLLSRVCQGEDSVCVEKAARLIAELHPEPGDRERFLGVLKERGEVKILDEFRVRVDLKRNLYLLQIPSLGINDALVDNALPRTYERIFSGLWGIGVLRYTPGSAQSSRSGKVTPVTLVDFEPFQTEIVDARSFAEAREEFTTEEWVDLLVTSIGLNPAVYSFEQKVLLLVRLVPLVEPNVNTLELGPRATGKTYVYRNLWLLATWLSSTKLAESGSRARTR